MFAEEASALAIEGRIEGTTIAETPTDAID